MNPMLTHTSPAPTALMNPGVSACAMLLYRAVPLSRWMVASPTTSDMKARE